ncbi:MAG: VWA domain-containing protein [Deltaproteobacteria bacterium]|nr:VWA domain-containing protein [Deltaproteobacteria bacterium]
MHGVEAEVVLVIDASPRMAPLYANGVVQALSTALLALAMKFDDDGVVPIWSFADEARHLGEIKSTDHAGWIARHVPLPRQAAADPAPTRYAPFIDAIGRRYFPNEWSAPGKARQVGDRLKRTVIDYPGVEELRTCPVFVVIVTSGDCDDSLETTKLLRRASHLPIFWQFAGIRAPGDSGAFRFLRGVDKLTDTHVDGCGFFEPEALDDAERLFNGLLNELPRWMDDPKVRAMLVQPPAETDASDGLDALLMGLPAREAARREKERLERIRRREMRQQVATLEVEQAAAWPRIRAEAEADPVEGEDTEPEAEAAPRRERAESPPRRVQLGTRPYNAGDGIAPALPPRRPTVSFSNLSAEDAPPPSAVDDDDEQTVETAAERLARIRARRTARKTNPS